MKYSNGMISITALLVVAGSVALSARHLLRKSPVSIAGIFDALRIIPSPELHAWVRIKTNQLAESCQSKYLIQILGLSLIRLISLL